MPRIEHEPWFRVREVINLGTDVIYIGSHELLLVDADLSEAEYDRMVRLAEDRYGPRLRLVKSFPQ